MTDSTARIVDVEKRVVAAPEAGVTVNSVSARNSVCYSQSDIEEIDSQ